MDPYDQELLDKRIRGGLPPRARRRVLDYIAAHLDQKITNDALAQIAGLSTAYFCTVFKQTEGVIGADGDGGRGHHSGHEQCAVATRQGRRQAGHA